MVVVSPEDCVRFHSQAFTATAPGWYQAVVAVWYFAAVAMVFFMVCGWMAHRAGITRWRHRCGIGWGIATGIFLIPILVTSCSA